MKTRSRTNRLSQEDLFVFGAKVLGDHYKKTKSDLQVIEETLTREVKQFCSQQQRSS